MVMIELTHCYSGYTVGTGALTLKVWRKDTKQGKLRASQWAPTPNVS